MEINGSDVTFLAYGFLIRYLLKIRANYFGENIHFQTLEEFACKESMLGEPDEAQETATEFTHTKTDNDLDVLIYAYVQNGTIVLPCNIYSAESHLMLNFASFDTDIRFTNYYMDLQTNISPIKGMHNVISDPAQLLDLSREGKSFDPTIFIDGIIIHGNRLFGLPPTEPTYFCKWDFDIGSVLINGPQEITQHLGQAVDSAAYTYVDSENGLLIPEPILYDVTYLSLRVTSLKVVLITDQTSLEVATNSISLDLNDLANERYSSRITITIPLLRLSLYEILKNAEDSSRIDRELLASVETSILVTDFVQKRNFAYCREKQQQHIALHDAPFDRCPFLLDEKHRVNHKKPMGNIIPSVPLNLVPPALTNETMKYIDPNMVDALGLNDFEEGDTSASSRSQFSNFGSNSPTSSVNTADDDSLPASSNPDTLKYHFKFAGKEINGNAFLPPEAWKQFEQVATEIKEKLPDFGLNPSCYYSNEETISPSNPIDPEFEYDSFVIQVGDVIGFLSPKGLKGANVLLKHSRQQDLQSAMDTIQIDVLKNLNYIRIGKPEIKNFRVSVSSIDLKYGTVSGVNEIEVQRQYEHLSHFSLKCDAIAIAFSSKHLKTPQKDVGEYLAANHAATPTRISLYVGCQNLLIGVVRGKSDINFTDTSGQIHHTDYQPLMLQLENPEFWFHEGTTQNSSSTRLRNINLSVMNEHLDWVCRFITHVVHETMKMQQNEKIIARNNQTRTAYVLHTLSMAGETFNIEDDPSVLTRPAFIIQSSKHVRANDSWKIITRLRHILKSVPPDWRQKQDLLVQNDEFDLGNPEEAKKDVLNVFNRWRSWEMESMERSYVFRHAFNTTTLQDTLLATPFAIVVDLECIAIRLHYTDDEDFLCFDYLKLSAGWMADVDPSVPAGNPPPLKVDCSIGCSNVRSRFSTNMLMAYDSISPYLSQLAPSDAPESPDSHKSEYSPVSDDESQSNLKKLPLFSVSAMILVQNMSTVIETPSISCALEMKDIELSTFVEQLNEDDRQDLGLSFAIHFDNTEFRVSERVNQSFFGDGEEVVLITFSISDYKGSMTSSGPVMSSPKYIIVSNDLFQLLLNKPVEYIANVGIRVLEVDYVELKPLIEKLIQGDESKLTPIENKAIEYKPDHPNATESITSGAVPLLGSIGFPVYIQASCVTAEIRLNISASWCFYIATSQYNLKASITKASPFACELSLNDQEIGLLVTNSVDNESGGVRRVTSLNMPSFTTMVLFDERPEELFADIVMRVEAFEVSTLSLTSVLRLLRSEMTRDELLKTVNAVKELTNNIETTFGNDKSAVSLTRPTHNPATSESDTAPVKSDKPKKPFRIHLDASVEQTVLVIPSLDSSLMLEIRNIRCAVSSLLTHPISMDVSFDDMAFSLQNDTWSVHTSTIFKLNLQLLYSVEAKKGGGKQGIEIKSEHLQIMLCQRVVEKFVEIEYYLEEGLSGLEIYSTASASGPPTPQSKPDAVNDSGIGSENAQFTAFKEFAGRTILQMEMKNAVFAWLFEEEISDNEYASDAKGILFGYDLLQVTSSSLQGRTSLKGVYITPTFNEFDIFHLNTDKENSVNTAYLPQVNLLMVYSWNKHFPLVTLELSGDSLRISLLPSIVTIVVCAAKSIANTIESASLMFQRRERQQSAPIASKDDSNANPVSPDNPIKYSLPFSFHLTIGFDGATISLWNPRDVTSTAVASRRFSFNRNFALPESQTEPINIPKSNTEPSLWLQAPAVDAVVFYTKGETPPERDVLNGEILISSTNNKVYPKVVPCVMEMSRLIQDVLKQSNQHPIVAESDLESILSEKAGDINDIDLEEQFGNIIVDVRIRLAKQDLMLSCEPTARVAATVSYDDLFIGLNSSEDGLRKTSYSLSGRLTNFTASLQHIYSREVSGMISIENIILFVTKDRSSSETQAILVAAKISDINTEINIKQSQDLELFQDIWYPGNSLGESTNTGRKSSATLDQLALESFRQPNEAMMDGGVMRKYRRVTSTNAIPWRIDFTLANVRGMVDLGQAVGQVTFTVDKFWLSSRKTSSWEQNLVLGFDEIKLESEGRLGGLLALRKVQLSTAIMWQRHDGGMHPVPLVQAIIGVESLESRVSFDFHSFALVSITALHLSMFNQRDRNYILNDRLAAVGNCESISVYVTSLAASNVLDLYYTLQRMRREANASYNAILRDSARPGAEQHEDRKTKSRRNDFKPFEKLRTFLDVNVNLVSVYIFPDSLVDLQVFTITIRGAEARYSQEIEHKGTTEGDAESVESLEGTSPDALSTASLGCTKKQLVCSLDMKLTELMVALSTYRKPIARVNALQEMDISEYVTRSREAKGGTIIGIPICDISMQTWQDFESYNIVDYIFLSSFGGRVDVGWNLGSVNFIKGMWDNHTKTFTSRRETYEMRSASAPGVDVLRSLSSVDEDDYESAASDSSPSAPLAVPSDVSSASEAASVTASASKSESTDEDEEEHQVYIYRPLRPPVIAQPQLRDMGEATPPVEWIGLHRKKLPSFTHQAVIVSLQKMVEEVELVYRQVLGHS